MNSYLLTAAISVFFILAGLQIFPFSRMVSDDRSARNLVETDFSALVPERPHLDCETDWMDLTSVYRQVFSKLELASMNTETIRKEGLKIMVLSDVHVMAPSLVVEEGKALEAYIQQDRKLLRESPDVLRAAVEDILSRRPHVVFLTGDLTKDGELVSHRLVADSLLKPLVDAGIRVFVIPGNHDVNNPHAVRFMSDTVERVATVSPQEFARIYSAYGYGSASSRDTCSLSYLSELNDSVWVLGIDACRYRENDFDRNISVVGGKLQEGTLRFIQQQAERAKQSGARVLALMHHGLVPHWKYQDKAMGEYVVEDWKKVARMFSRYGINLVFTGHFHAQDIASFRKGKRAVYDIETGSTVSYPLPIREMQLFDNKLSITSYHLTQGLLADSLEKKAVYYALEAVSHLVPSYLPEDVPAGLLKQTVDLVGECYVAHIRGDEQKPADFEARLDQLCSSLKDYSPRISYFLKILARSIYTDNGTADNNVVLSLPEC